MGEIVNALVVWFNKGLRVHKLQPIAVRARGALAEAFKCYAVGLVALFAAMNLVFFLRTDELLNKGEAGGIWMISSVQVLNSVSLITLFFLTLRLLKTGASLQQVTIVCCYGLGGMLSLCSLPFGYFLFSAIQKALEFRDIRDPYVTNAILSGIGGTRALSDRVLASALLCLLLVSVVFYCAQIIRLLSAMVPLRKRTRVKWSLAIAWLLDLLAVKYIYSGLFWWLLIKMSDSHARN